MSCRLLSPPVGTEGDDEGDDDDDGVALSGCSTLCCSLLYSVCVYFSVPLHICQEEQKCFAFSRC